MAALGMRFRAELRSRWRAWLTLMLLAGVAAGLVMAMGAASRRTASTYDRFLAATNAADAYVGTGFFAGDESLELDRIARLPQVAASQRRLLVAAIARSRSGRPLYPLGPGSVEIQAPKDGHLNTIDRPKLLHGRLPDPTRPNEALADTKSIRDLGLRLGDATDMRFHLARMALEREAVPAVGRSARGARRSARADTHRRNSGVLEDGLGRRIPAPEPGVLPSVWRPTYRVLYGPVAGRPEPR